MKEVLDFLLKNELIGVSENVDIAKGKYELASSFKEARKKIKRIFYVEIVLEKNDMHLIMLLVQIQIQKQFTEIQLNF